MSANYTLAYLTYNLCFLAGNELGKTSSEEEILVVSFPLIFLLTLFAYQTDKLVPYLCISVSMYCLSALLSPCLKHILSYFYLYYSITRVLTVIITFIEAVSFN